MGNIDQNPQFIFPEENDYRLRWGSPCIDAGVPNPTFNDPDGSIADMGAFYYDQSVPVRILLTPHEIPIQIPEPGGSFDYTLWLTNIDPGNPTFEVWVDVTLPDGTLFGPLIGPVPTQLDSGLTVSRERTQVVPPGAPEGTYNYKAYAVVDADTSYDSFNFVKLVSDGADAMSGGLNSREPFGEVYQGDSRITPTLFALPNVYPNPFNPTTVVSYKLQDASNVNLTLYDISGRKVAELVNGWRDAGVHEVVFDAAELASGIYFVHLVAGGFNQHQKTVYLK
jgi:hypothetical protein